MLKDISGLCESYEGYEKQDIVWIWDFEECVLSDKVIEDVVCCDDVYLLKSIYDSRSLEYKGKKGQDCELDYSVMRSILFLDIDCSVEIEGGICKVYNLDDVTLYHIVDEWKLVIAVGNVVIGYIDLYYNVDMYYDLYNNSINYKKSGVCVWYMYDNKTIELLERADKI